MIIWVVTGAIILLAMMTFIGLYVAYKGPTACDRVVAINMIATKVTTMICALALITHQQAFVNVSLVYALIGFVTTIGVSKYLMKGKLS